MKNREHREEIRKNSMTIPLEKSDKDMVYRVSQKHGLTMAGLCRMIVKEYCKKYEKENQ